VDIEKKRQQLICLYGDYVKIAQPYLASAVCRQGCADCCTTVGSVDITTLEGLIILRHLKTLNPKIQKDFNKRLKQNRKIKQESRFARCAFLGTDNLCAIYPLRPFSCRRLYSIRPCGENGPTVHRQAWEAAEQICFAVQQVDDTGYLGHMSYILQLLNDPKFLKTYLSGGFSPEEIRTFAMSNSLVINRAVRTRTDVAK
jgi:Fe-S-cluster containining protein